MAKSRPKYQRVAQFKTVEAFKEHLKSLQLGVPVNDSLAKPGQSPMNRPYKLRSGREIGNRFCILPMEGWDGTEKGLPGELTRRRWHHFAVSGAKLIWGCEAVAVSPDGRANPNQLVISKQNLDAFKELYESLIVTHEQKFQSISDLLVGLQLTHSGRFSKPDKSNEPKPKILYRHSLLDKKLGIGNDYPLLTDEEIQNIIEDFITAAKLAENAGFDFIDIKHCHGYLGHEFLSAYSRNGSYGGTLENRMRFLESVVQGIKATSTIQIGVRLSAFDWIPFYKDTDGTGKPELIDPPYREAFGGSGSGIGIDLTETFKFIERIREMGIELLCITAGSPYYVPHIQRPALFPPSDGYLPPEDPLAGVDRQIRVTSEIKNHFPDMAIVGSAYSYLQEWLPNVAEAVIEGGHADFVGLGRMVLSYPEMPSDILSGKKLDRQKICRTFSDCTTAPRHGMPSGCYPLDGFYKQSPDSNKLIEIKRQLEQ